MNIKIIYYSSEEEISLAYDWSCKSWPSAAFFCDQKNQVGCHEVMSVEDPQYEAAFKVVFDQLNHADSFEKALGVEVLIRHYSRIQRFLGSFRASKKKNIVCLISASKINVYDLAFEYEDKAEFYAFQKGSVSKIDLWSLLVFYFDRKELNKSKMTWYRRPQEILKSLVRKYKHLPDDSASKLETSALKMPEHKKRNTLFLCHTNDYDLYLKPIYPLLKELKQRGASFQVVALDSLAERNLRDRQIEFQNMPVFQVEATPEEIQALANQYGKNKPRSFYNYMFRLCLNSAVLPRVVRKIKEAELALCNDFKDVTDIFLVPDGTPEALYFSVAGAKRHLDSHMVVAAGIHYGYRTIDFYFANHVYCYGQECEEVIKSFFPSKQTHLTGNPTLYMYGEESHLSLGFDNIKVPTVLIATSFFDPNEITWIRSLLREFSSEELIFVVKPHPFYQRSYDILIDDLNGHILLDSHAKIEPVINNCKLVITDHSQVGKDAHLLGKAVISMCLSGPVLYLRDIPSLFYCHRIDDLIDTVKELKNTGFKVEVNDAFIKKFNFDNKQYHYQNIADILCEGSRYEQ